MDHADSPRTHREVIDRWPSLSDFAGDIAVPYGTAKQMRRRSSIPEAHWVATVVAARVRGISGISYDLLASLVAADRERACA